MRIRSLALILFAATFGQFVQLTLAQTTDASRLPPVYLLDAFGSRIGSEERSVRLDALFSQLGFYEEKKKTDTSVGYVLIYCGKICRYGEVESHIRGIELKMHARSAPRSRLRIVAAGYREELTIELWVSSNANGAPVPTPTVNIKNVTFIKASRLLVEAYDCCDDQEHSWKTFKP